MAPARQCHSSTVFLHLCSYGPGGPFMTPRRKENVLQLTTCCSAVGKFQVPNSGSVLHQGCACIGAACQGYICATYLPAILLLLQCVGRGADLCSVGRMSLSVLLGEPWAGRARGGPPSRGSRGQRGGHHSGMGVRAHAQGRPALARPWANLALSIPRRLSMRLDWSITDIQAPGHSS